MTNYELGIAFSLKDEVEVDQVTCKYEQPPGRYGHRDRPWVIFFQVPVVIWLSAHALMSRQMQKSETYYYGSEPLHCALQQCHLAKVILLTRFHDAQPRMCSFRRLPSHQSNMEA